MLHDDVKRLNADHKPVHRKRRRRRRRSIDWTKLEFDLARQRPSWTAAILENAISERLKANWRHPNGQR
jgi:hypothetical protein